jgi:hypothetical protein
MITIDEQIEYMKRIVGIGKHGGWGDIDVLASLEELKRIKSVQVPEGEVFTCGSCGFPQMVKRSDYDTLRDLLKRESERADDLQKLHENKYTLMTGNALAHMKQRAIAAESKLAAIEKMGREPSEELIKLGARSYVGGLWVGHEVKIGVAFKAMFVKMMEVLK